MAQEVDEALRVIAMCGSFIVTMTRGSVFLITQLMNLRKILLYSKWEGQENYKKMMKKLRQNGDIPKILDLNTQDTAVRDRITKMLADNHCLVSNLPDLNSQDGHLQIQVAASQMSNVNLVLMKLAEAAKDESNWAYGLKVIPIDEMRYMQTGTTIDGKARPELKQLYESIKQQGTEELKIVTADDVLGHVVTYRTAGSKALELTKKDIQELDEEMKAFGASKLSSEIVVNMKPIDDDPVKDREGVLKGKFFEISASENGSAGKVVFIPDNMLLKYQKEISTFGSYSSFAHIDLYDEKTNTGIRLYDAEVFEQLRHGDLTVDQLNIMRGAAHEGTSFERISSRKLAEILDAAGVIDSGKLEYDPEISRQQEISSQILKAQQKEKTTDTFTIEAMNGFNLYTNEELTLEKAKEPKKLNKAIEAASRYSRRTAVNMKDSNGKTVATFVNGKIYSQSETDYIERAIKKMENIGKEKKMVR